MIKIRNHHLLFLLLIGLGITLVGCSGPPSEGEGKQAIENRIKNQSDGRMRVVKFQKTNGQLAEVMGVKVYTLEYETEIEFLEACKWNIRILAGTIVDDEASFHTSKLQNKPSGELAQLTEMVTNPGTEVSKGQTFKLVGAIRFEKKEKGWSVDGVKVASITSVLGSANPSAQIAQKDDSDSRALWSFDANAGKCLSQLSSLPFEIRLQQAAPVPGTLPQTTVPDSRLPDDLRKFREKLSTPQSLFCPADKKRKPVPDWTAVGSNGVSYEFVGTGQNKGDPWIKCPIHGFVVSSSFRITTSDGSRVGRLRTTAEWAECRETNGIIMIKLKSGKWADVKSVFPDTVSAADKAKSDGQRTASAKTQLNIFRTAIDAFQIDNGFYPKNGLIDLERAPQKAPNWRGPYLPNISKDSWSNDYIYQFPGTHNPTSYDLMSMGPDGRVGGGDDICNWP